MRSPGPRRARWSIASLAAVLAMAVLCGWALLRWASAPYSCNAAVTRLTRQTTLVTESAATYARVTRARRNIEDLRALAPRCPTEVRVLMMIGANEEVLGRYEDAALSYRRALRVEQRPEIHAALADALIQLGRTGEAVEHYTVAARFNPAILELAPSVEVQRRTAERLRDPR